MIIFSCSVIFVFRNTTMNGNYGCAILAGGAGRRMGNINKADLEYGGKTFADSIMSELSNTSLPCYVSVANYEQRVPCGWKQVKDSVTSQGGGFIGPMGGIYSCLMQARKDGLDGLFFAPCDVPLYTSDAISKLAEHVDRNVDSVIWRSGDGRLQMTFAYYSTSLIPILEKLANAGKYSMKECLDKAVVRIVDASDAGVDEKIFSNINSIEDYNRLINV